MRAAAFLLLTTLLSGKAFASGESLSSTQLCNQADIVLVGTVSSVSSSWRQLAYGQVIFSSVTFTVERMVHGPSNLGSIGIEAPGGKVGTVTQTVSGATLFAANERYVLLLNVRQGLPATILAGGRGAVRLDAGATLPSLQYLQGEYEEVCGG